MNERTTCVEADPACALAGVFKQQRKAAAVNMTILMGHFAPEMDEGNAWFQTISLRKSDSSRFVTVENG